MKAGQITEATINDNVGRILRVILLSGIMDNPHTALGEVDTPEQQKVAREGATEGIVLLKNQGALLPLDPSKIHSIAVIGPNAAGRAHRRRRQFAGAAQVCDLAARWNHEARRRCEFK